MLFTITVNNLYPAKSINTNSMLHIHVMLFEIKNSFKFSSSIRHKQIQLRMVTIAIDCRTIIGFVLLLFSLLPNGCPMDLLRSKLQFFNFFLIFAFSSHICRETSIYNNEQKYALFRTHYCICLRLKTSTKKSSLTYFLLVCIAKHFIITNNLLLIHIVVKSCGTVQSILLVVCV